MKLKKILALLLAAMMVLGMTGAMAADAGLGQDNSNEPGVYEGGENTLKIKKSVVVENDLLEAITVAYPAITYTYSAAKADGTLAEGAYLLGVTVTDKDADHTPAGALTSGVKNGVVAALTITSAAITSGTVQLNDSLNNATKAQELVSAEATVTIIPTKYNNYGPGIYRYKISDMTTDATLVAAGIVRGADFVKDFYLDVYIGWKLDSTTGAVADPKELEVKGYVLSSASTTTITPTQHNKESGFEQVTTDENGKLAAPVTDYSHVDLYKTYNVELQKNVTGSMGDTTHEFPFTLTVTNNNLNYIVVTDDEVTGPYADITAVREAATPGTSTSVALNHQEKAYIVGLAPHATIGFMETNDTDTGYKVSATVGGTAANVTVKATSEGTETTANTAQLFNKTGTATIAAAAVTNYNPGNTTVASTAYTQNNLNTIYTNNLDQISPTNVALRFGPYLVMFAAGAALFLILLAKRREEDKEEN